MRSFIVYGAGAVGGVIAARLHLGGEDVQVVARGAHLSPIRRDGCGWSPPTTRRSSACLPPSGSPTSTSATDTAVLVAVKSHQTAAVMHDVARSTPPDVTLVSAQNGVANEAVLLRGRAHVVSMVVMLPSSHLEPGIVVQGSSNKPGLLDVGRYPSGTDEPRAEAVAAGLRAGGFESIVGPDIMAWKYRKLMLNLGNAAGAACPPGRGPGPADGPGADGGRSGAGGGRHPGRQAGRTTDARRADHLDTATHARARRRVHLAESAARHRGRGGRLPERRDLADRPAPRRTHPCQRPAARRRLAARGGAAGAREPAGPPTC